MIELNDLTLTKTNKSPDYIYDEDLIIGSNNQNKDSGPTLTIEPGVKIAFAKGRSLIIQRGSKIIAQGTRQCPIIFSSIQDLEDGTSGPEDVQQWGGIIINGFGVTNNHSTYVGNRENIDFKTQNENQQVNIISESVTETYYGGADDDDNSGALEYVIIKHAGDTLINGNELNALTLNAVGSETTINHIQIYSCFDDGIECFGGAVDLQNIVCLNVRDDSIDLDQGYRGNINNVLIIQQENDGNRCFEIDGISSYSSKTTDQIDTIISNNLHTKSEIKNVTAIASLNANGSHDPGAGIRIREGADVTFNNMIIYGTYSGEPYSSSGLLEKRNDTTFVTLHNTKLLVSDSKFLTSSTEYELIVQIIEDTFYFESKRFLESKDTNTTGANLNEFRDWTIGIFDTEALWFGTQTNFNYISPPSCKRVASATGDPYITPLHGSLYKLPNRHAYYRLYKDTNTTINGEVVRFDERIINALCTRLASRDNTFSGISFDLEHMYFFNNIYISHNNKSCIFNLPSQKFIKGIFPHTKHTGYMGTCKLYKDYSIAFTLIHLDKTILKLCSFPNPQVISGIEIITYTDVCTGLLVCEQSSKAQILQKIDSHKDTVFVKKKGKTITETFVTKNHCTNIQMYVM